MAISKLLEYVPLNVLLLDNQNPRLRRDVRRKNLNQAALLEQMSNWTLDELVDSFSQSGGFWTEDALIVIREVIGANNTGNYIVIEGNRRLAALKLIYGSMYGSIKPPKWLADRLDEMKFAKDDDLFSRLPILVADSRDDVSAYLGFRHVTGIKEWRPVEKAEFITGLIESKGLNYKDVAREIGSRTDTVRQNYTAFKMLMQMEATEGIDWNEVEERFSILFLSIRSGGTRDFLGVTLSGDHPSTQNPIPDSKKENAKKFATWVFGDRDAKKRPVVKESRNIDKFGEILASSRAVDYLSTAPSPDFETAYSLTSSADLVIDPLLEGTRHLRLAIRELEGREADPDVQTTAWQAIECGVVLARRTGVQNLARAKEALSAA